MIRTLFLFAVLSVAPWVSAGGQQIELASILAPHGLPESQVGYLVFDVNTGEVLESHNPDQHFIPASVAKVPSSIAALATLGPDHRFLTEVVTTGPVVNGVVQGDLFLVGGGDPTLSTDGLAALAEQLSASGIVGISGSFRFDEQLAPPVPAINDLQPVAASYNPGVGALSINFNRIGLTWRPGGDGTRFIALADADRVDVELDGFPVRRLQTDLPPGVPYQLRPGGVPDFGTGGEWQFSANAEPEGFAWIPIREPGRLAATLFREIAGDRGIALPLPVAGSAPLTAALSARHQSDRLDDIVQGVLRYSNNMAAEMVGLAASRAITGTALSPDLSALTVGTWFEVAMPQVGFESMNLDTHSGLSSTARLSPRQTAAFLAFAHHGGIPGLTDPDDFPNLLHPMGYSAGLAEELAPDQPEGAPPVQVRAKTGTMHFGRGLAGYIDAASGRRVGFAIFTSDLTARADIDRVFNPDVLVASHNGRRWLRRARAVEEQMVRGWAARY